MNLTEAKFILESYRHHGGDAHDSQLQEALNLAQQDPILGKWLAEQNAFNHAVSQKVKSIEAPADLKSKILAGRRIIRPTPWWKRREAIAAMAACFIIFAALIPLLFFKAQGDNFALYRRDMTTFLSTKLDHLDMDSSDLAKIRDFLNDRGTHGDLVLPEKVAELRKLGCRILDWHGEKVTLVCFKLNGPQEVHLLVASRSKFKNPPGETTPALQKSGDWMTASWSRGDKVYILAGMGDRAALEKFL